MAATGGNTGVVRQASRGTSTGLQSDQERRLFGDACTVVTIASTIPFPSLRAIVNEVRKTRPPHNWITNSLIANYPSIGRLYTRHEISVSDG